MKNNFSKPLISVCIPVYQTERFLIRSLRSAYEQDFSSFEIIIVSDASNGKDDEGKSARKIVKIAKKSAKKYRKENNLSPVNFKFIEHSENRGLIEVRRTLCYEASGQYITQLDSDDELEKDALKKLYESARNTGADIIHGTSTAGVFSLDGNFIPLPQNRYGTIYYGNINGRDVFRSWLIEGKFTAVTWGKLIKRNLWRSAYENIPYTECNMADDVMLFFFLAQYAKSYVGIEDKVYHYRVNTGMSSVRIIDTIKKWKMVCSAASVFTVISEWLKEQEEKQSEKQLMPDEVERIRSMTIFYLKNNLQQMKERVIPELQAEARALLCDFWGENFVCRAEKSCNI